MAPTAAGNPAQAERLLPIFRTKLGIDVLRIHWSALPDYDIDEASKGLTDDMRRQELEVDWTASTDKRVFPEFGEMHVAKDKLRFDPRLPLTCGWDFGGVPAWCPTQLGHDGQWKLFPPLVGAEDESVGIYDFAERVAEHLTEHYCKPHRIPLKRLEMVHFGDPYGNQLTAASRSKNDERLELRTAFDILRRGMQIVEGYDEDREPIIRELPGWGWVVRSGPQDIPTRLEAIRARLTKNVAGRPALIVCPTADTHIHAFYGAYHYKRRNDGTYEDKPEKNWWSHPQDALQYVAASLFTVRPKGDEDPRNGPRNDGHRSHAARRDAPSLLPVPSLTPVSLSALGVLDAPARSGWVAMIFTNGDRTCVNGLTAAQVFDIEQQIKANRHGAISFHDQHGDWMSVLGTYVRAFATSSGVRPEAGEGLPRG